MPLNIVVLDCSNYPQLVVVEETNIEASKKRWTSEGMEGTEVYAHLSIGSQNDAPDTYVADALAAWSSGDYRFHRGLDEILEYVFRCGRKFEREYPEGRGSKGDHAYIGMETKFSFLPTCSLNISTAETSMA